MNKKKEAKATIKIPRNLYNHLKAIIEDSGFDSVTDFVVYVLRDIVAATHETKAGKNQENSDDQSAGLTAREIDKVRERLKRLGYF
ncbi:CopG family transcriptional regulator [bacterium]|nr:CopG family transcriptional regulator [bacterium]